MIALRPYQEDAAQTLAQSRRKILADPIGSGKTRTVLRALQLTREIATVICPAAVVGHWWAEAEQMGTPLMYVQSYENATKYGVRTSQVLILDESHYLRNTASKRTKTILGYAGQALHVDKGGVKVWALTGTPMPRSPLDLYAILHALWPSLLETAGVNTKLAFLQRFCRYTVTRYGIKVYGSRNSDQLRELLSHVMIRRKLDLQLPPLRFGVLTLTASDVADLPTLDVDTVFSVKMGDLEQALFDPILPKYVHAVENLKAPLVAQIVENELEERGRKIVVMGYHLSALNTLRQLLGKYDPAVVVGMTPDRISQIGRFQEQPTCRVFLGQIGACGTGMDGLQYAASDMLVMQPSWNSSLNRQAVGRLLRLGQKHPVQARFVALEDTIDEAIVRQHMRETEMVTSIVGED